MNDLNKCKTKIFKATFKPISKSFYRQIINIVKAPKNLCLIEFGLL